MKKLLLITLLTGVLAGKTSAQDVEMTKKALRDSYTAIEQKDFARFASHLRLRGWPRANSGKRSGNEHDEIAL
jgi:hypothetical protein